MIAITGGGTGGHLAIAKAICKEYNKQDIRPIFIGSTKGQDMAWFEGYPGFSKTIFLPSSGVVDKKGIGKALSLINIIKQSFTCRDIFKKYDINRVFSVGGYSAAPAAFASVISRKKLYIHEQNAISGKLNKVLKPFASEFFGSYNNASLNVSYPVEDLFFDNYRQREVIKTILFLGGSQGASFINSLAKDMAKELNQRGIKIIHQCGKKDFNLLKQFYDTNNINVDLFDFSKSLHVKMREADFAISRAGASSLWELVANGLPTFFIPFPYAASNHQYYNAKVLSDKRLAFLKSQQNITKYDILNLLDSIQVGDISVALKDEISQNGAKDIVKIMENES